MENTPVENRRRGGRAANRRGKGAAIDQLPWSLPVNSDHPTEPLSAEGVAAIHDGAMRILEEIGIEFRDDAEALAMWKDAGADVHGERVHFPKGLCRSLIATAPPIFTQHARNSQRSVKIGGKHTVFAPVYGPPFIRNLDEGRRYATIEDFRNFVKLTYSAPAVQIGRASCRERV